MMRNLKGFGKNIVSENAMVFQPQVHPTSPTWIMRLTLLIPVNYEEKEEHYQSVTEEKHEQPFNRSQFQLRPLTVWLIR